MAAKILFKDFLTADQSAAGGEKKVNVEVEADLIKRVGNFKPEKNYDQIIQGHGRYLLPGFIDLHSHADLMNYSEEGLKAKIRQGVTTEVCGQCGLGPAPISEEIKMGWQKHMIIRNPLSNLPWESTAEYFSHLTAEGLENNILYFQPHGLLRYYLKQGSKEKMSEDELKKLEHIMQKSFRDGAAGVSLGLCYFPAVYSDYQELKTVFKSAAAAERLVAVHLKSEGSKILESLAEIIELKEATGARVNISHLKVIGEENEYKLEQLLAEIEKHNLSFDSYPYNFGSTSLKIIIPPDFLEDDGVEILKDQNRRKQLKKLFESGENPYDNWENLPYLLGWDQIMISALSSSKNEDILGLSLQKIAQKWEMDPAAACFKLLLEEDDILMQDYYMREEIIEKILKDNNGAIGTDSLFSKQNPHPRTASSYSKLLKKYVFKDKILSLADAVYKTSQRPAEILGLKDRGQIAAGKKADLLIFSREELMQDNKSSGFQGVMINGSWKVKDSKYLKEVRSGQIIKF